MSETNYGKDLKKICFEELDKVHADLKIRLHYDGIKQNEFFRMAIKKYLEKDDRMLEIINEYKELKRKQSKLKIKKSKKLILDGQEIEKQFALDESEVDKIFDIIAEGELDI